MASADTDAQPKGQRTGQAHKLTRSYQRNLSGISLMSFLLIPKPHVLRTTAVISYKGAELFFSTQSYS